MAENPFDSGAAPTASPRRTRATRWLIWLGVAMFGLGVVSVFVVIQMAFDRIVEANTQPKPGDLAADLWLVEMAHWAVLPLFLLGGMAIIAGFLIRRPVKTSDEKPREGD